MFLFKTFLFYLSPFLADVKVIHNMIINCRKIVVFLQTFFLNKINYINLYS